MLILSYFYPPCNLAAANRASAWAGRLAAHGLYPVVVTRSWEYPISHLDDVTIPSGNSTKIEKSDSFELHALPYRPLAKDRWKPTGPLKAVKKMMSMMSVIGQHVHWRTSEFAPFYRHALTLLHKDRYRAIVVTGNPWGMFRIAQQLSMASGVPWVADYRDIWTATSANVIGLGLPYQILFGIERWFERKILSGAVGFTSISEGLVETIGQHIGKKGQPVLNGYLEADVAPFRHSAKNKKFTITYVGTLYNGQDVSVFARAAKKLISQAGPNAPIEVCFLGAAFNPDQAARLHSMFTEVKDHLSLTSRTGRKEVLKAEAQSHILLHVGWAGHTGIVGSKIYEYMASGTPVLICPTDHDVLEAMVTATNTGHCATDENDAYLFLRSEYDKFLQNKPSRTQPGPAVRQYSREAQTEVLARYIKQITPSCAA